MLTPFPIGRIARFDERSRAFAVAPSKTVPRQVVHRVYGARLDQKDVGACTGFAGAGVRNTTPNHHRGEEPENNAVGLAVYQRATELDEFDGTWKPDGTGQDTGSSGLAACKAMVEMGIFTRYEWCFGMDHLLQATPDHPVMAGTNWYEGMFNPSSRGIVTVSGALAGGHEWVVRGHSLQWRLFYGLNSWGKEWGLNGLFAIPFDDMARLLKEDGDLKVPIL